MTRSRALLAIVLVLVCLPFSGFTPPPNRADAATPVSTGSPGTLTIRDNEGNPGAVCQHLVSGQSPRVTVTINAPTAQAFAGDTARTIEWQPLVYQMFSDGSVQLVTSGAVQTRQISFGTNAVFTAATFSSLPEGPVYQARGIVTWRNSDMTVRGTTTLIYSNYRSVTSNVSSQVTGGCFPVFPAEMSASASRVTVDTNLSISGRYFPVNAPVSVIWNGKLVDTWMSDANGEVTGVLKTPAAPVGDRPLQLTVGSWWKTGVVITIAPRIKMLPATASRGDTVKISLRGFAKKESVRIRWKQGTRWIELGWATMSNTGSGELWVAVPVWATEGANSIRGDGSVGRAQTNVAKVSGGLFIAASEATPALTPVSPESGIASPAAEPAVDQEPVVDSTATVESDTGITPDPTVPVSPPVVDEASPEPVTGCTDERQERDECDRS